MVLPGGHEVTGSLTLIGTPIGNLGDISARVETALREADLIAAEDTRRIRVLLSHLGITGKEVLSLDANREESLSDRIVEFVKSGKRVAYCTDAGMPGISDPGSRLVRAVVGQELEIDAIPGPSASSMAASLSGLCQSGFVFVGFLPPKPGARKKELERIRGFKMASVVFESPNRVSSLLKDAADVYGLEHQVFVGRELTKFHQELFYGTLSEGIEKFSNRELKGELTIVFGAAQNFDERPDMEGILELVFDCLASGESKTRDVASQIAEITGAPKNKVYQMIVAAKAKN